MLGKIDGRRSGQQRMRHLDGITYSMDMNLGKLQEMVRGQGGLMCCQSRGSQRVRHDLATEQQQKDVEKLKPPYTVDRNKWL